MTRACSRCGGVDFIPNGKRGTRCRPCHNLRSKEYQLKNKEKVAERAVNYYLKNKERIREVQREYEKTSKYKVRKAKWVKDNSVLVNIQRAKRRARLLDRIPKWVDEEESFLIEEFYSLAKLRSKLTNIPWEVDHKIPLKGKLVSGLHVPNNLDVISMKENRSKHNKYEVI